MNNNTKISVVISYHNTDVRLERALESVIDQSYAPNEIILIDDGSTNDYTINKTILKVLSTKFDIVLLSNQNNEGLTYSLKKAITISESEYIARLDADDYWLNDHLSSIMQAFGQCDYNLIGGGCFIEDEGIEYTMQEPADVKKCRSFRVFNKLAHSSVVFERNFYDKLGGYDERFIFSQDFDLWLRFQNAKASIGLLQARTVVRPLSKNNIGAKNRNVQFQFSIEAIEKNENNKFSRILYIWVRKFFFHIRNLKRNLLKW